MHEPLLVPKTVQTRSTIKLLVDLLQPPLPPPDCWPLALPNADLHSWTWFSITKLMHVGNSVGDPHSWAGRALVLAYGFLVLIMLHIYTAASAVQLTAETVSAQITNLNDLQGKAVITWEFYVPPLAKRSLFPDGAPW
jgi:hypothetical protein